MAMREVLLKLDNVSKSYPGVRALDNVTLECHAGEVHAVLGENGSGKSTLMKIASGIVRSDSGRVTICGTPLTQSDPRAAQALGLATVYQDDSLVRELSVAENLYLGVPPDTVRHGAMMTWAEAQLAPFGVRISVDVTVQSLTPAQRQFVEIVKALLSKPRVLLLDEPTATLDREGVQHLSAMIRDLAAAGTAIVFVSHRLPEILALAHRVTILRDGLFQGTFDVDPEMDEHELVSLMAGREIEHDYPPKPSHFPAGDVLKVTYLRGRGFGPVSFHLRPGEILGLAGAEGNGQREVLRAIAGLEECHGEIDARHRGANPASPRQALENGITFLSGDRAGEAAYSELSVQTNMTAARLGGFVRWGLIHARAEDAAAAEMKQGFGVVAARLSAPVGTLSGGNQQKAVLARSFSTGACAFLIDEPTQGVDAGARADIYRVIRRQVQGGEGCLINSSDAQELAGLCDRVLVFSRGQIVRELTGAALTERAIVESFLTARDTLKSSAAGETRQGRMAGLLQRLARGSADPKLPIAFLLGLCALVAGYAALRTDVFLSAVNLRYLFLATVPAALAAMAQMLVLLIRGIDISVGSLMSLTVVLASFTLAQEGVASGGGFAILGGILVCLAAGTAVGAVNGVMVRRLGVNAVITTVAMLSILQGAALVLRPIPGGNIATEFTDALRLGLGFVPFSLLLVMALAIGADHWLYRSRGGLEARACGFREEAARRNGVRVTGFCILAFVLASACAALAGLFLAAQVGVGHPTVGEGYAMSSIAAAVLGGAALTGGRGSFVGALLGAFFFTLMMNVISILGLSSSVAGVLSGGLTLLAIFLYSGLGELDRLSRYLNRSRSRNPAPRPLAK